MRPAALLLFLLVITTACSDVTKLASADRKFLFFPDEIEHFPIGHFQQKTAWDHVSYVFLKKYSEQLGFGGMYGTILMSPGGAEVQYLCLVYIPPTTDEARDLFRQMIPEPMPRDFGREETIDPGLYQADDAYLYTDDTSYFHLVLLSSRVVYTVLLDGARVQERQVRNGLRLKLAYLEAHLNEMR
jgi:hypothetical protein